jgi:tRNA acetyltransferase TAN1
MLRDFNLLATTSRGFEGAASSELWYLIGEIGDSASVVEKTGVSGLFVAKTILNPFDVIEKLRKTIHERPYEFRYTLRIIPIEKVVRTDLGEIQLAIEELSSKIGADETFRVTVEKRFTQTSSKEIIEAVAARIEQKVDLINPDKIVLVEVIGGLTGVSVMKPEQILVIMKEKL